MATSRNNDHPGNHGSVVFECDAIGCDEELDTEYTTWDYARSAMKREGWYILPDGHGGWDHFCPVHGKVEWIQRKRAEEAASKPDQSALPPFMRRS